MYVCWFVTYKCDSTCSYCFRLPGFQDPTFKVAVSIGKALISSNVSITTLTGGEPFKLPYIYDLIDFFHKDLQISITTNAQLLTKDFTDLLLNKISYLSISLDTMSAKTARTLKGRNYYLEKTFWAINETVNQNIPLKINTVVTKINQKGLQKIGRYIESLDDSSSRILWKLLQVHKNKNVKTDISELLITTEEFTKVYKNLQAKFPNIKIIDCPSSTIDNSYILVSPNGEVILPSRNYLVIGNIRAKSLQELINQKEIYINNSLLNQISILIERRSS